MTVQEALALPRRAVKVRFEVRDTDGTWYDLSDRFDQDRLISTGGGLSARYEKDTGAFSVQLSSVTVWNGDRFWDWYAPPNPSAQRPAFLDSYTWHRLRCRMTLVTAGGAQVIGHWLIDKISTRAASPQATITLKPLESILIDAQADRVREGKQFWRNKPIGFNVRRLLETRHTVAEVAAFTGIQNSYQIPLSQDTSGPVISSFARAPETPRDYQIYGNPIAANNDSADGGYGEIWFGLEEELWKFNADTGVWTYWTKLPASLIALGVKIHHVYVSTLRQKIVALAWAPQFETANTAARIAGTKDLVTHDNVVQLTASMTTAPAAMTELGFVSSNYYTGLFSLRAGRSTAAFGNTYLAIGGNTVNGDAACAGVNVPSTQQDWKETADPNGTFRRLRTKAAWNSSANGAADADMWNATHNDYWAQENGGYLAWTSYPNTNALPLNQRYSIGQYAGAFAFNEATDEVVLTWVAWDAAALRYSAKIVVRNIQTGALTDTGYYVKTGDRHYLPTSMQFNDAGNRLLVTAHAFKETAWAAGAPVDVGDDEPMGAIVVEFDWPLAAGLYAGQPAQVLTFLNTNFAVGDSMNRRRWIPLDARYGAQGATRYAAITMLDYSKVGGTSWGLSVLQMGSGNTLTPYWSTGRIAGLGRNLFREILAHDAGRNAVIKVNAGNTTSPPVVVDDGIAPVDGDNGLTAGLVWSKGTNPAYGTGVLIGISSPGPAAEGDPDIMNPAATGKFYVYQIGGSYTDRVELADWSGMTVWDALSELASMADFVFGYDPATGDFFFRLREKPTATLATIKATGNILQGDVAAQDIGKEWGYDEIFNYAEVTPSRVILAEPTGEVQTLERPVGWSRLPAWNGNVTVVQRSLTRQQIVLRVVEGGRLGNEDDGCVAKDRAGNVVVLSVPGAGQRRSLLRLAWLTNDFMVETQLVADWMPSAITLAGRTIVVPYVAALDSKRGSDPLSALALTNGEMYGDTVELAGYTHTIRDLTHDAAAGTTSIVLDSITTDGPVPIPAGTRVIIRSWENQTWSDSALGVARTADPNATKTPGADGVTTTYAAISTRNLVAGMIARPAVDVSAAGDPDLLVTQVVDGVTWKGRRVGTGGDTDEIRQFRAIRGYVAPVVNVGEFPPGYVFWIGQTGIGLIFEPPDASAGGVIETPFMVGDEIHIDAKGLMIDEQELAKHVASDRTSIDLHGVSVYRPARRSRLLNYARARETARRIVKENAKARYVLEIDLPLTFMPRLGDCLLVEDPRVLTWDATWNPQGNTVPVAPDTARGVAVVVRGYTVDPIQGRCRLSVRAVNPHDF